jgi:type VI secretion system protein ImpJ
MTVHAVNWHEGMFLRPQHFQTAHRYLDHATHLQQRWDVHYCWGLRSLELDEDSLANFRFVVRSLQARLRDGTSISVPEDLELPPLPLRNAFPEGKNLVTVYLALPLLAVGQPNSSTDSAPLARFRVQVEELEDENTGVNPQTIQVRQLNAQLLLSHQDLDGYEVVPIARLEKSTRAEALPEIDKTYFPPVLACDAWSPLSRSILQAVHDRIGKKIDLLAAQVVSRGITFDTQTQGDPLVLHQLRELNEAYTVLNVIAYAQGVHPLMAYTELARIVGQLAIFGARRGAPDLPKYDHDDLARCFQQAKAEIDLLLDVLVEPQYKERAFLGAGMRMQVSLEPAWLEPTWQIYIGVQSTLDVKECAQLLTKAGQLDMKLGSSDRVDDIFRNASAGLRYTHTPQPPQSLPTPAGQVYFQVARATQDAEWQHVQRSLSLAVRLNENFIAGNIQGQRVLSVKHQGKTVPLQFILYVVPQNKPS